MAIIHDGNSVPISSTNPLPSSLFGSEIQVPVDIQSRYATTTQTHAGTLIAPSGISSQLAWMDCNGFDEIALTFVNDANASSSADILWSNDGVAINGKDVGVVASAAVNQRAGVTKVKARYCKVILVNGDAAPHTMSAWAYLKA